MKKVLFVAFMVMAFMAIASMAAFACGGDKAEKASAKSASACSASKTTDAKLASSKAACCASKTNATMASSKTVGDKAACASLANADGKTCTVAMCIKQAEAKHAELCGDNAASHHLVAMSIKGMTCGGCESTVRTALMNVEGVTNVIDVCYKAGYAVVCTNKADFKNDVLVKTVAAKGYESEIIPAVAVTTTETTEKSDCAAHKKEGSN